MRFNIPACKPTSQSPVRLARFPADGDMRRQARFPADGRYVQASPLPGRRQADMCRQARFPAGGMHKVRRFGQGKWLMTTPRLELQTH